MKNIALALSLVVATAFTVSAQSIGKVTKITTSTSASGTIVFEDTLSSGAYEYVQVRRGDVIVKLSGTGAAAKAAVYNKVTKDLVWAGSLSTVYVLLAGGNPSTQTNAQKLTYLKANTY